MKKFLRKLNIFRNRRLLLWAVCLLCGLLTGKIINVPLFIMLIIAGVCLLGAIFKRARAWIFICVISFSLGAWRMSSSINIENQFDPLYNIEFSGTITGNPYIDADGERFVCRLTDVTIGNTPLEREVRLDVRDSASKLQRLDCGQRIRGTGHSYQPDAPTNPYQYDMRMTLSRDGMNGYITAKFTDCEIEGEGGGIYSVRYNLQKRVCAKIDELFGDNADIVRALIVGDSRDMDENLRDDFSKAGVAHLLAVSGLHISLLAMFICFILNHVIGVRASAIVSILLCFAYVFFVGMRPSALRAFIMFALYALSQFTGRHSDGATRLAAAFIILTLINPLNLFDYGFILSFCASGGLVMMLSIVMRVTFLSRINAKNRLLQKPVRYAARLAGASFTAQLASAPAVAICYNSLPLWGIFVNVLIVPIALAVMYLSLAIVPLCMAFENLAFLAEVPNALITFMKILVSAAADLPLANISVPDVPIALCVLFFIFALFSSDISAISRRARGWMMCALPLILVSSYIFSLVTLDVVYLDVGQADSIAVRLGTRVVAIDVGEDAAALNSYLNGSGSTLSALFLTHPHDDHAGGITELKTIPDTVYIPAGWENHATGEIGRYCAALAESGTKFVEISAGDVMKFGNIEFEVLSPEGGKYYNANNTSIVLKATYKNRVFIFTGDATIKTAPDADVLKIAHHGARECTPESLIASAKPEYAVISVGENTYGHPNADVINALEESGAKVMRTDECGAVTVRVMPFGSMNVSGFIK